MKALIYEILGASTPEKLEDQVNEQLKEGWEIAGPLCLDTSGSPARYYQPMIFPDTLDNRRELMLPAAGPWKRS